MPRASDELERFTERVAVEQERRAGRRMRWSREIRDVAVGLVEGGVGISELARRTGIERETIRFWRRQEERRKGSGGGFREIAVVSGKSSTSSSTAKSVTAWQQYEGGIDSAGHLVFENAVGQRILGLRLEDVARLLAAGAL